MSKVVTIERFIYDHQPQQAHGDFTNLLYDIALAAKMIAYKTNRAGLTDILGRAGAVNIQGEEQQKLDVFANNIVRRMCDHTGRLCVMATEEQEGIIEIPEEHAKGAYVLVYDPLDGSSNIDVNVSIGTIFGIYRCLEWVHRGRLEDVLQPARDLVGAGYVLYGSSTMLVYSTGEGVHGFTLDPEIGEFLLSHENMTIPEPPSFYSVNHSYYKRWSQGVRQYVHWLEGEGEDSPRLSSRYIGSLVADVHRNFLRGGIFLYPGEEKKPEGKIRLLYEAGPLAYLAEQAGGYGSNGRQSLLSLKPSELHERTPIFLGNRSLVERAEGFIQKYD